MYIKAGVSLWLSSVTLYVCEAGNAIRHDPHDAVPSKSSADHAALYVEPNPENSIVETELEKATDWGERNFRYLQQESQLRKYEGRWLLGLRESTWPEYVKSTKSVVMTVATYFESHYKPSSSRSEQDGTPIYGAAFMTDGMEHADQFPDNARPGQVLRGKHLYRTWSEPEEGRIVIKASVQGHEQNRLDPADALIAAWLDACRAESVRTKDPNSEDRLGSGLKQISIEFQADPILGAVAEHYLGKGKAKYKLARNSHDKDAFFAVLGSSAGTQVCRTLYMYSGALGYKIITSILVSRSLDRQFRPTIKYTFELKPYPSGVTRAIPRVRTREKTQHETGPEFVESKER